MSHRGYTNTREIRAFRRKNAEARQAEYDKLTLQQKLDRLPANGAKRQRARLEAAIASQNKKAEPSQTPAHNAGKSNNNQQNKKEGK